MGVPSFVANVVVLLLSALTFSVWSECHGGKGGCVEGAEWESVARRCGW